MNLGPYAKALNGTVLAGLAATTTALVDGVIDGPEWSTIAGAVVAAVVAIFYATPNGEVLGGYAKTVAAALTTALGVLGTALTDGAVDSYEWTLILTALLSGFVVSQTPNALQSDGRYVEAD